MGGEIVDDLGAVVQAASKISGSNAERSRNRFPSRILAVDFWIAVIASMRILLMQDTWHAQHELRDPDFELSSILRLHLVTAPHRADLGGQHRAAGIFEALARLEQWLLAHHTLSAHFLNMVMGIRDDPMAADELGSRRAEIGNADGVGKHETVFRLIGLFWQVIHLRFYDDAMLMYFFHARHLNPFSLMSQGLRYVFMLIFAPVFSRVES